MIVGAAFTVRLPEPGVPAPPLTVNEYVPVAAVEPMTKDNVAVSAAALPDSGIEEREKLEVMPTGNPLTLSVAVPEPLPVELTETR